MSQYNYTSFFVCSHHVLNSDIFFARNYCALLFHRCSIDRVYGNIPVHLSFTYELKMCNSDSCSICPGSPVPQPTYVGDYWLFSEWMSFQQIGIKRSPFAESHNDPKQPPNIECSTNTFLISSGSHEKLSWSIFCKRYGCVNNWSPLSLGNSKLSTIQIVSNCITKIDMRYI